MSTALDGVQGQAPLTKMGFEKRKAEKDEWYTPEGAIYPILKYLKPKSRVWCPFDTKDSNYCKILSKAGHEVICTSLLNGEDFFLIKEITCDYIISNPPFS